MLEKIYNNKKSHFWIFFAVLCLLTLFMMYRYSSFISIGHGYDAGFQFNRFVKLVDSFKNGTFPVYIDEGVKQYGYATKLFYPDFILIPFAYIGTFIGYVKSYQLIYFIATVSCGFISYISIKNIFKDKKAAYISAILYTFCLYRLQDLYERAALAEAISFSFIPLIFWGIYEIIRGDYKKWYIICIGFSLCILTHVLSTLMAGMLVSIFVIIGSKNFIKEPKRLVYLFIAAVYSIIVSGYYLFPYIEQIMNDSFNYQNSILSQEFTKPGQKIIQGLFIIGITDGRYSGFFPSIGLTLTLPLFFRICTHEKSKNIRLADIAVIVSIVLVLFTFDNFSLNIYRDIKLFTIIQFSWRFLNM